jgi:hypothetical protein
LLHQEKEENMNEKKGKIDIERRKNELVEKYKKHLDEIFEITSFDSTFDEIEKSVDSRFEKNRNEVIETRIECDPDGISANDYNPDETCSCICGACATLCRDDDGNAKITERDIKTKRGKVKTREYGYYCSHCRKVFFPSAKKTKARSRKL